MFMETLMKPDLTAFVEQPAKGGLNYGRTAAEHSDGESCDV
jgi:hypothetical protein